MKFSAVTMCVTALTMMVGMGATAQSESSHPATHRNACDNLPIETSSEPHWPFTRTTKDFLHEFRVGAAALPRSIKPNRTAPAAEQIRIAYEAARSTPRELSKLLLTNATNVLGSHFGPALLGGNESLTEWLRALRKNSSVLPSLSAVERVNKTLLVGTLGPLRRVRDAFENLSFEFDKVISLANTATNFLQSDLDGYKSGVHLCNLTCGTPKNNHTCCQEVPYLEKLVNFTAKTLADNMGYLQWIVAAHTNATDIADGVAKTLTTIHAQGILDFSQDAKMVVQDIESKDKIGINLDLQLWQSDVVTCLSYLLPAWTGLCEDVR